MTEQELDILASKISDKLRLTLYSNASPRTYANSTAPEYTADQKMRFNLRGDVMCLTEKLCAKYSIESVAIFAELKKLQNGVKQPEASPEQLSERVDILQQWLSGGIPDKLRARRLSVVEAAK